MLHQAGVSPMIPVTDSARAKKFYAETLGFPVEREIMSDIVVYSAGGGTIFTVYKRPKASDGEHTLMTFLVKDLMAEVKELNGRGVTMEQYPQLATDVMGISAQGGGKAAWFKDPDGNVIGLVEM